jgi:para-aminobenzoate synthetase/4-amino-4-deoxychorismate lyase
VRVSDLFAVRRYSTLWQMTSTVTAQTRVSLTEIFSALFPAASITGAPKARTMALIRELETSPRRIYTGTIGFLLPDGRAQFNVAIRTLLHDCQRQEVEYGVGGGIVADSSDYGEWEETRTKSLICREPAPVFSLIETLLWCPATGFALMEAHLRRLQASAEYFAFPCNVEEVRRRLNLAVADHTSGRLKLRLLLDRCGTVRVESAPLPTLPVGRPFRLVLAGRAVDHCNPFLYHKTTHRVEYAQARSEAPAEADDVLFFNCKGELTETSIANLVLTLKGRRYTPPLHCGLLPGTYRQHLLEMGEIEERCLSLNCLAEAEHISLINSVRGQWPASLVSGTDPFFTLSR